jgi:non-specific serine/threonine protein kinase/serine/threonine-protein kinase
MTTRFQRINSIFDRALELPDGERAAYLDEACAGDAALRAEIARLLDAHERASRFIEKPIDGAFESVARSREKSLEGKQIGAWRVLKEIGRGGMGTVWLGERADKQFEQRVAIKLIHPGMDTEWVVRRFRTERRILAGLDHPHIARLYDGGTTEEGVPYFVMEHIEGVPIDRYCDEQRLSITKRLELFRQVCSAVSFAHQSLVIHRDIKPSNVLVASDGTAKLLDFGIATILQDRETGAELHTATVQQLMTPEYASPEQVEGRGATTLSDVYALGVMLYELLCGRAPYRFANRSLTEIARVLGDAKPERPSASIAGESAERIGGAREGSVERLRRRLRGDLDTIVLKAMHADPQHRYASVEQLSEDIRRHLVGLPVIARPDTIAYRTRKFVARNRAAVGAALLVALALVGGFAATTWQAQRAREAQARAERRFADLRKLARAVLFDYHDAVIDLAGSTPVRERLVADGLEYLDGLAREAGNDVALQRELAEAYLRMGDVQGGVASSLGKTAGALESYRKANAIYASLIAADSSNVENMRGYAVSLVSLSRLLLQTGATQEASATVKQARRTLEPLVNEAPSDLALRKQLAAALDTEGLLLFETGDYKAAVDVLEQHLEQCEAMAAIDASDPAIRRQLSVANDHLSVAVRSFGDFETALQYNRKALELRAALAAEFPLNADYQRALYAAHFQDGAILTNLGRTWEALESYERSLAIVEKLLAVDPKNEQFRTDHGHALLRLADTRVLLGDLSGALAPYRASLELRSAQAVADPENFFKRVSVVEAHTKFAKALAGNREYALAVEQSDAAVALLDAAPIDEIPVGIKAAFAERFSELGDAYSMAAAASQRDVIRRDEWKSALDMYRRSAAIWTELRDNGLLAEAEAGRLEAANRAVARCTEAIASS